MRRRLHAAREITLRPTGMGRPEALRSTIA
jgi:hypothetical protein